MDALPRTPLNVTQKAEHRIFVGLSWDPNEKSGLGETLGALISGRDKHHDLDLSCFYYDENKNCLGYVTAEPEHYTDASGAIYHSGDNVEGVGDGDDEQISVNLKSVPHNIHHIIFKTTIQSGHVFGDIADPAIRLCDGYTEHCFAQENLNGEDAKDQNSFVFLRLYKYEDQWHSHSIMAFSQSVNFEECADKLKAYLD